MNKEIDELAAQIQLFSLERDWGKFHTPKNLAIRLSIECAELMEQFNWQTEEDSRSPTAEQLASIKEEVGDVVINLLNLCSKLNIDPLECGFEKLKINSRKYPVEKFRGVAEKYNTKQLSRSELLSLFDSTADNEPGCS